MSTPLSKPLPKRVLVTGASGFIGVHVCRALLAAGCEVGALVRPGSGSARLAPLADNLTLLRGDIYDHASVSGLVTHWRPQACLHLAWYVETGKCLHSPENLHALKAGLHLLQCLAANGCEHVITAGTCAEYDAGQGWLKENSRTKPENLYGAAKLSLNLVGQQIARQAKMGFAHARIFYVYGPGEDTRRVVPGLIHALRSGKPFDATPGAQVRDYLHVEDVASAFVTLLSERTGGEINVASGVPVSIRELMETVGDLLDRPKLIRYGAVPYRAWDPMFLCADVSRLCALGWRPHYSLRDGLRHTIDWWRDNAPPSSPS